MAVDPLEIDLLAVTELPTPPLELVANRPARRLHGTGRHPGHA
jgi:hypothetical protein